MTEGEAPEERSRGLWGRHRVAPELFLSMIGPCDGEVVKTRRPQRHCLCHGEDRLRFGETTGPFLQSQVHRDRDSETHHIGCCAEQHRARVRSEIAICGGNREGARGPVYAHLRDASFAGG